MANGGQIPGYHKSTPSKGVNRARAVRTVERERLSKARERGRVVALTVELDTLFIDSKNGFAPRIEYPSCAQQLVYCRGLFLAFDGDEVEKPCPDVVSSGA